MQIIELILYGYNEKIRHLMFHSGKVNIITGASKTGKSAVGDIIEYCLGGSSCKIADGVVRDNVAWYGLILQFDHEQVFVARKNPDAGRKSTSECYYEVSEHINPPQTAKDIVSNTNVDGIETALSNRLGITENLNIPNEGDSREALTANIRHALFYCFQGQGEIANQNFLFHRQSETFILQAIKDTLPYFLGVKSDNAIQLENKIRQLNRELRIEQRSLAEKKALSGNGLRTGISLIREAISVGIIEDSEIDCDDYENVISILSSALNWKPDIPSVEDSLLLSSKQEELEKARNEYSLISEKVDETQRFINSANGFKTEAGHEKTRLSSIGLFDQLDFDSGKCPFCSHELNNPLPSVEALKESIVQLDQSVSKVDRERPQLAQYLSELQEQQVAAKNRVQQLKSEIDGIIEANETARRIKDQNVSRAHTIGRISLWLENINPEDDGIAAIESRIQQIENEINNIDQELDNEDSEERLRSVMSRINADITAWADILNLEYKDNPYRLSVKDLTVYADTSNRPVPLQTMGSGANWLGVHIITYFALQKVFIEKLRPVPGFIFFDQPSQAYFPADTDPSETDLKAVKQIYNFMIDRCNSEDGQLQIIVVDHADINDSGFQSNVIENWQERTGRKLIPVEWYS